MPQPPLYIVILNNDRQDDTDACLTSLLESDYKDFRIVLLNHSLEADSSLMFQRKYPQIHVVSLAENLGYAGNNNIGINAALDQGAEWIFVLNNDTVLDRSCLSSLMNVGNNSPTVGILGPMVYHFNEPGVIQSAGGLLGKYWQSVHVGMNENDRGQYSTVRQVDWVSGCAILVRRSLVEHVGALDPDYFLYWEETEWCIRARRAGWKILHVPNAKLWHKGVKRNYQPKPYVTYYMTRNYLRTLAKHNAPLSVRISALANILRILLSWSVKPQWRFKRDHRNAMWRGLLDFLYHRLGPMPS
jgi:GT2 family glycosyltransferase